MNSENKNQEFIFLGVRIGRVVFFFIVFFFFRSFTTDYTGGCDLTDVNGIGTSSELGGCSAYAGPVCVRLAAGPDHRRGSRGSLRIAIGIGLVPLGPRRATPRHAAPRHATPRHATR